MYDKEISQCLFAYKNLTVDLILNFEFSLLGFSARRKTKFFFACLVIFVIFLLSSTFSGAFFCKSQRIMKKRKEMMDSGSSDDEESSKSSDEESKTSKKRQKSPRNSSDSESESDRKKSYKKTKVTSSSSDDSGDSDGEDSRKDVSKHNQVNLPAMTSSNGQAPTTTANDEDKSDLEEGQLSSDSESGDESSSDSEFDDGYGEDLMGDENDRNYLEKLSEKERETELFKRAEKRDDLKRRWEIERKIRQSRKAENAKNKAFKKPSSKKPKTPAAKKMIEKVHPGSYSSNTVKEAVSATSHLFGLEEPASMDKMNEYREDYFDPKERSKERKKNVEMNKTDDKRSSAMAMLKARREGKQKREVERTTQLKQVEDEKEELEGVAEKSSSVKLKARDIYSDDSDSDSEDKQSQDGRRSSSSRSSTSGSESDDVKSQATVYKKPEKISTLDELNKLRISRYKLEKFINLPIFEKTVVGCFVRINIGNNSSTQKLVYRVAEITAVVETPKIYSFGSGRTNKGLKLKHGTQERVFRLEFVSNQDFTENEFDKWKEICDRYHVEMPTVDAIAQKKKDVLSALNYEYKEEDIDRIIEEKNRFRSHPTNYAMKKTQLMKERDAAILQGNEETANNINLKLSELEERANALDKKRTSSIQLISYINDRNRKKNVEEAEKAILEEARATKGMKFADPFTRRSTKPKMAFKAHQEAEEEIMMAPEVPKLSKLKDKRNEDHSSADVYSLHDFEIDLDVPLPFNSNVAVLPKPVEKIQDSGPKVRRSLNLEDYKKKRGLI